MATVRHPAPGTQEPGTRVKHHIFGTVEPGFKKQNTRILVPFLIHFALSIKSLFLQKKNNLLILREQFVFFVQLIFKIYIKSSFCKINDIKKVLQIVVKK